ncbi:hypothetical protein FAI40_08955 [Acetobacteraceae bacterium]|nr:hypothetical protein FAI40_08955 [Acetobacteraceae bacterium]
MKFSKLLYTASSALAIGLFASVSFFSVSVNAFAKPKEDKIFQQSKVPTVSIEGWGQTQKGKPVQRIVLSNAHGVTARILTYGATLQSLEVPDASGKSSNVVLGFKDISGYEATGPSPRPYFGATIGRVANRIPNGTFMLDDKKYDVPLNANGNAIHGGKLVLIKKFGKL